MAPLNQDIRSEVLKMIETHRHLRVDTELLLETTPRKAQYSSRLVDLMQKEEESLRSAELSPTLDTVFHKIDELIKMETGSIFDKIVDQNIRKWTSVKSTIQNDNVNLSTKLTTVKKHLQQQKQHKLTTKSTSNGSDISNSSPICVADIDNNSTTSSSTITTLDYDTKNIETSNSNSNTSSKNVFEFDILAEQLRLESYYNDNWIEIEGDHLKRAFQMQETKINTEWEQQEKLLLADMETKRQSIQDKYKLPSKSSIKTNNHDKSFSFSSPTSDGGSSNSSISSSPSSPKWHDKEKQKSLIHTAPVLAPVRDIRSRGSRRDLSSKNSSSSSNVNRNAGIAELMKLEREHAIHVENMKRQKLAAKRWMTRQSLRLNAQANSMINERKTIASLIKSDLALLNQLKNIEKIPINSKNSK